MIKIAVIGTGMLVNEVLPVLYGMPEIELAAIVGTKRSEEKTEALKKEYAIADSFSDFDEMLEKEAGKIDLVYIATPNNTHFELARKSIEAGFNTFVEKPFVESVKEAETLFELAKSKNVIVLEAISNQYLPAFETLAKNIGRAGEIKYAGLNFSQYSSRYDRFLAGEYFKVFDAAAGGGALKDLGIYNLHVAVGLFGLPEKAVYYPNIVKNVDTSGVAMLDYKSFKLTSAAAKDCQGDSGLMIEGTEGYFKLSSTLNSLDAPLIFHDRKTNEDIVLEERHSEHRMEAEFRAVEKMIIENDRAQAEIRQKESLDTLRLLCGISNPSAP